MVKFKGRDPKGCLLFWREGWDEITKSKLEHVNMVVYIYMILYVPGHSHDIFCGSTPAENHQKLEACIDVDQNQ